MANPQFMNSVLQMQCALVQQQQQQQTSQPDTNQQANANNNPFGTNMNP